MPGITWLHLSDWHQGRSDHDRDHVLTPLIEDIHQRATISNELEQIDFIVFTGDIANQAKASEYGGAMEEFFNPVIKAVGHELRPEDNKIIFLVPGNHDIDRSQISDADADCPIDFRAERGWVTKLNNYLRHDFERSQLLSPFSAYSKFVFEYFRRDDSRQSQSAAYSYAKRLQLAEKTIVIVGLNSAILSGRNKITSTDGSLRVDDYGHLALAEKQIDEILPKLSGAHIKIALMHHPFSWLVEEDRVKVQSMLSDHFHFILHGHEHMPRVEVTNSTLGNHVVIPAGSSYSGRYTNDPRYTNAYNFVHLDFDSQQATVYLRRWHDSRSRWDEDIESAPNGRVVFPIQQLLNLPSPSSQSPSVMSGCTLQESHWHKPGNVFYVVHDIHWTIESIDSNHSKASILHNLNQAIYHLRELGGKIEIQEDELLFVKEQLTNASEYELREKGNKRAYRKRLNTVMYQLGPEASRRQGGFNGRPK